MLTPDFDDVRWYNMDNYGIIMSKISLNINIYSL